MDLREFARRVPKAELHVHLEGSIRPPTLLELARRNDFRLPAQDVAGLEEYYRFRDFDHFIEVYLTITRCLQTPDDYRLIAYEFGADRARMNVRYSEVTFSVETNMRYTGLPWQAILGGLNAGRTEAREDYGVDWRWVFDIVRNLPETQDTVVDIVIEARDRGVVALGLGGSEHEFPPELFARSHARAVAAGVPRVPHAGEVAGPESVWNAIRLLHADRLGHGVRSAEDPDLVSYLVETQTPIEACPTSNIRLGIYPDYSAHPLRELWDAGVLVTVNSDDPPMFDTDLNREYLVLVDHFGFDAEMLEQASLNAVRASFLPASDKARLERDFRAEFADLREALR